MLKENFSINQSLLKEMLDEKFLSVQKHPQTDLWIYNYTPKAQYERLWNEITLQARGLILDKNYQIQARPFPKFFNYEELESYQIPSEPFEVYEKMDGSLGILYWWNDRPYIATRGSFSSSQAQFATKLLYEKYALDLSNLEKSKTYLFEIIFPENRIVVNYENQEALILLAIIETQTGQELPLENIGFEIVKKYDIEKNFHEIKQLNLPNREGFVIKFQNGFRLKIKFEEYVRLHRLMTKCSTLTIWEFLAEGKSLEELIEKVPDEFYTWVKKIVTELQGRYAQIEAECHEVYHELPTRKETALYFQSQKYSSILFAMLDKKDYAPIIWRLIKPTFSKPFHEDVEITRHP